MPARVNPPPVKKKTSASAKPEPTKVTKPNLLDVFGQWANFKETVTTITDQMNAHRDGMKAFTEEQGYPDEKGSLFYDLPQKIGQYIALKNERRVSQSLNMDKAEQLVDRKGIRERCTKLVLRVTDQERAMAVLKKAGLLDPNAGFEIHTFLDEDAIMAAHYDGVISEAELDTIFDQNVTYSFNPVRER